MADSPTMEDLLAEARYHRHRDDLYRAKMYGPGPTTRTRFRELERAVQGAEARLRRAQQQGAPHTGGCRVAPELGLQASEPLAHGVQAEEQLPGDVRLVVHRRGGAEDLGLARAEPESPQRLGPKAGDLLLEQQRVR